MKQLLLSWLSGSYVPFPLIKLPFQIESLSLSLSLSDRERRDYKSNPHARLFATLSPAIDTVVRVQ